MPSEETSSLPTLSMMDSESTIPTDNTTTTSTTTTTTSPQDPELGGEEELFFSATTIERHESDVSASTTTTTASSVVAVDEEEESRVRTLVGSIANLCSATLGAGILALPFAFYQAGIICGVLLLAISAWATSFSIGLLVETCDRYHFSTYEKIVERGLGRRFRSVVEVSILIFCCGTSVGYVIAVGDIMERVIPYMTHFQKKVAMSCVWLVAMVPLSCLKKMKSLECASSVGIISIGTLLVAAIVHLVRDETATHHYYDYDLSMDDYDEVPLRAASLRSLLGPQGGSWWSVLEACPIFFYAFSCQVNVAQIFDELPGPEKIKTMNKVTTAGVLVCGLLYAGVSLVTLIDFGDAVQPNILSCYDLRAGGQPLLHVAFLGMALAVVMAFPLNIFPARVSLVQMWDDQQKQQQPQPYPATTFTDDEESSDVRRPLLSDEIRNRGLDYNSDDGENDPLQSSTNDEHNTTEHNDDDDFRFGRHAFVTLLLTGMALGLALVVPNISVVFGLLGGTTSSLLGFVVPGLLGLQLDQGRIGAWILVVCGSIIGILTTGVTVYSMV